MTTPNLNMFFKVGYDPAYGELYLDCRVCHATVVTVPGCDYTLHSLVDEAQSHRCPARLADTA